MTLFGTSGIRRIADASFVKLALQAGIAAGGQYGDLVIAGDPRTSGDAVKHAFIAGALISGAGITDIGLAPTPTLAIAAEGHNAGVMITASHNPPEYNGMKFVNPNGSAFNANQQGRLESAILQPGEIGSDWVNLQSLKTSGNAVSDHIDRIISLIPQKLNLKVVLDCGGGAGSVISPAVLCEMGCDVIEMNCIPNGNFPRPSEPTEENLRGLAERVRETGADLGIAHDGDADRMMAVDDRGRFIPGDKLLVIFARAYGDDRIVTTLDASMMIDDSGYEVVRTKIGDNYVSEELKKGGRFGGEPSGSWVFPEITFCPDGIFAAARLASIASEHRLSELVEAIPEYPSLRMKVPIGQYNAGLVKEKLLALAPRWIDEQDGLKAGFDDGWIMIRPSGTEPILRLTVEGRDDSALNRLLTEGQKITGASR